MPLQTAFLRGKLKKNQEEEFSLPENLARIFRTDNHDARFMLGRGNVPGFVSALFLPGTTGNYASTPDSPAISIVGDIDIRVRVAMVDWTPAVQKSIIAKSNSNQSWGFVLASNGTLGWFWFDAAGTFTGGKFSTVPTGFADNALNWARVTFDVDNGAEGSTVRFYTSDDGITWGQLGTDIITAGVTNIRDGTDSVILGSLDGGVNQNAAGNFFHAEIRNGIDGPVVAKFEPRFASRWVSSFISATGEVWTVSATSDPFAHFI